MRLRQRDLKTYYLRKRKTKTDVEGLKYSDYDTAVEIKAKIQPAGGKVMAEMYGERLNYIKTMYYDGSLEIKENDGICVYVGPAEGPDYKVVGIAPWDHNVITLEKVM